MLKLWKFIRRLSAFIFLVTALLIAAIIINARTFFFRDIGTYIPFIEEKFPKFAQSLSELSEDVNSGLRGIPLIGEHIVTANDVDLPIDPEDVASNAYYASDTMLTFNNKQNISVDVSGNSLEIYGITNSERYLVYQFLDVEGNVLDQIPDECDSDGEFRKRFDIPSGSYQFTVFTGAASSGEYISLVYNYIYLSQAEDGSWGVVMSPVYDHNVDMFEKDKSVKRALKRTSDIDFDDDNITAVAQSVTAGCETDYEKALALHDWVCSNIYYDTDNIGTSNHIPYTASEVLTTRRAVCEGYANLYAALCRAASIPCNTVNGYAPEMETDDFTWYDDSIDYDTPNHAWNEVHLDDRWVIVDTTWDSKNKIVNGVAEAGGSISYLYFDANVRFFSQNHKILKYIV
ncbi:MAG: transglutaminase domain-containing protein [Oscillospiraceae bacterium]|nr:transglutaminase domain-containing protein [Oscillospiraceae bacterium]